MPFPPPGVALFMCFCAVPVLSGLKRGASASDQLLPQVRPPPFLCCFLVRHATFRTQGQISNCAPIDLDINLGIDLDKQSHQSSNSTICGGCRLDRLVGERASCRISISEHRGPLSLLRPAPATCGTYSNRGAAADVGLYCATINWWNRGNRCIDIRYLLPSRRFWTFLHERPGWTA